MKKTILFVAALALATACSDSTAPKAPAQLQAGPGSKKARIEQCFTDDGRTGWILASGRGECVTDPSQLQ